MALLGYRLLRDKIACILCINTHIGFITLTEVLRVYDIVSDLFITQIKLFMVKRVAERN